VEFALILPIIFVLTLGLIDGARAILLYNTVSNAAREGARFGIVLTDPSWGDQGLTKDCNKPGTYGPGQIAACLADPGLYRDTIVSQLMARSAALDPATTTIQLDAGAIREGWPTVVRVKVISHFTPVVFAALGRDGFDVMGASEMIMQ
jgi:hypothetical protein